MSQTRPPDHRASGDRCGESDGPSTPGGKLSGLSATWFSTTRRFAGLWILLPLAWRQ